VGAPQGSILYIVGINGCPASQNDLVGLRYFPADSQRCIDLGAFIPTDHSHDAPLSGHLRGILGDIHDG